MRTKVKYILDKREAEFLRELGTRKGPFKNQWSGMREDDIFISNYSAQIAEMSKHKLVEKKDSGMDAYWRYGLNAEGIALQEKVMSIFLENENEIEIE
jgi:hypothetical protein